MEEDLPQPKIDKLSITSPDYAGILLNEKISDSVLSFLPKKDLLNMCLVSRKLNSLGRDFLNRRRRTWFIPVITPKTSWSDLEELETLVDNPGHVFRGIRLILDKRPRILRAPELHRIFEKIQVKTLVLDVVETIWDQNYHECWSKLDKVEYFECDYLTGYIVNQLICRHLYKRLKVIYAPSPSAGEHYRKYMKRIDRVLKKCPNAVTWASPVHCWVDDLRILGKTNKRHLISRVSLYDYACRSCTNAVVNVKFREVIAEHELCFERFCGVFRASILSIEIIHITKELFISLIRKKFPPMENVKLVYIDSTPAEQQPKYFKKVTPRVDTRKIFPNAHIYWDRPYNLCGWFKFAFEKYFRLIGESDYAEEPTAVEEFNFRARDQEIGDYFQDNILTNDVITDQLFRFVSRSDLLNCCLVSKAFKMRCRDFLNRSTPGLLVCIDPLDDLARLEELEDLLQDNEHPFCGIFFKFNRDVTYCMSRYPEELEKYDYLSTFVVSVVQRIISRIRVRALKIYCGEYLKLLQHILPTYLSLISFEDLEYVECYRGWLGGAFAEYMYFKKYHGLDFYVGEVFAEFFGNRNAPNLRTLKIVVTGETTTALLQKCPSLVDWRSAVYFSESESIPCAKYSTFVRLRKEHLVRTLCVECHEVEAFLSHPSILQYRNKIWSVILEGYHPYGCSQCKNLEQYAKAMRDLFPNTWMYNMELDDWTVF